MKMFVDWEEVFVTNNKGRKEVHYYLKRRDGGRDLAVVGKERSIRHMSYYYALRNRSLLLSLSPSSSSSSSLLKLRSRREVVDWLSSIVSDLPSHGLSQRDNFPDNDEDAFDVPQLKDPNQQKTDHHSEGFLWLGSALTCRKRRRHYQSFCRNGAKISVHDFVFIMAEDNKRLLAYLEDLYEDSRGNKMVSVRWFHKIDEVGIVLPANFNDREIFFSLCLQDLSIECIDGLATILSPQHFEKFLKEAIQTPVEPFMCHRQVDNDDVKPFDITQVQGYWKQELLRYMYTKSSSKTNKSNNLEVEENGDGKSSSKTNKSNNLEVEENGDDAAPARPKKRLRDSLATDANKPPNNRKNVRSALCMGTKKLGIPREGIPATSFCRKEVIKQSTHQQLAVGSHVEVLSQDSGLRGCWFKAVIIKRHKDKVKVQYQDIRNAVDEAKNLEEWVPASRIAVSDQLGLRICGRTIVRPHPPSNQCRDVTSFDVGRAVDAWWCDGWWEGIVFRKESEDKIHVYFPGEQRNSVFGYGDLRRSQDWVHNEWNLVKERPDLVLNLEKKSCDGNGHPEQLVICHDRQPKNNCGLNDLSPYYKSSCKKSNPIPECRRKEAEVAPNLEKDELLSRLKWKSSKKRKWCREQRKGSLDAEQCGGNGSSSSSLENMGSSPICDSFLISSALKVDNDNCKYRGDSLFNASIPPLSSLLMSR